MAAQGFHIEKKVSLGSIVSTLIIVSSALYFVNGLDKRISINETSIQHLEDQRSEDIRRIEKRLDAIDMKLDKLIEKGG